MESVIGDINLNIETAKNLIVENLEKFEGADFVILPEVWTVGWHPVDFVKSAENICNSKAVKMLSSLAEKYGTNIIGGSIIREEKGKH
jgi:predicted amidohydrolase